MNFISNDKATITFWRGACTTLKCVWFDIYKCIWPQKDCSQYISSKGKHKMIFFLPITTNRKT